MNEVCCVVLFVADARMMEIMAILFLFFVE
jgi:hypothetical protein